MESNNKNQGNSGSSLTVDLFGAKDKESPRKSSTGIFASIFPPPSQVVGRNPSSSELTEYWQKQSSFGNHAWNSKQVISGEGAHYSLPNKDRSSVLQEERAEPCHLSSSIYYGGQEVYSQSPSTRSSGYYPIFKKDGGEDDPNGTNSNSAARGNWWQGSLYY